MLKAEIWISLLLYIYIIVVWIYLVDSGLESGVDGDILWRCLMWSIPIWLRLFLHCVKTSYELYFWDGLNPPTRCGEVEAALPGLNSNEYHGIEELNGRERESKQTSQLHRNWTSRTIFICWPDTYLRMGFPLSGNWRVIKAAVIFLCFMGCFLWKSSPLTMVWKLVALTFAPGICTKWSHQSFSAQIGGFYESLVSTESMDNIVFSGHP